MSVEVPGSMTLPVSPTLPWSVAPLPLSCVGSTGVYLESTGLFPESAGVSPVSTGYSPSDEGVPSGFVVSEVSFVLFKLLGWVSSGRNECFGVDIHICVLVTNVEVGLRSKRLYQEEEHSPLIEREMMKMSTGRIETDDGTSI